MSFFKLLLSHLPLLSSYIDCKHNGGYHQMRIGEYLKFKIGINRIYWPKERTCIVANPRKIYVGKCCNIGRPGTYIQGAGKIYIGNYVRFGPNVGILSIMIYMIIEKPTRSQFGLATIVGLAWVASFCQVWI